MFAILITTLPTQPSAVRLRVWRALKALGCVALRDGAYVLPIVHAQELDALAQEVRQHGGAASVLALAPRDTAQELELLAQFDRSAAFVAWQEGARSLLAELPQLRETEARRRARQVADALAALQRIDYYPGAASAQAQAELAQLRHAVDIRFSRGEPQAVEAGLPLLKRTGFQRKCWATRARRGSTGWPAPG